MEVVATGIPAGMGEPVFRTSLLALALALLTGAAVLREALLAHPDPEAVLRYSELAPHDTHVVEVCLARLGLSDHPARALLRGRLAVAER